jgi:hypothetical protein
MQEDDRVCKEVKNPARVDVVSLCRKRKILSIL